MKVRIGVGLGTGQLLESPAALGTVIDGLEQRGFDSIWMSDRVTGRGLDPLSALAFAAGRTERLKLGTNVLIIPGRDPMLVAKQIASIDRLSDGRFLPAFGLGSPNRADGLRYGVERGTRGRVFEESLATIRRIWAGTFEVDPDDPTSRAISSGPTPSHPLEVWFGGRSDAALTRTGRLSSGWLGSFQTPVETGAARRHINAAAADAGRAIDPEHFGTSVFYSRREPSDLALQLVAAMSQRNADSTAFERDVLLPTGASELVAAINAYIAEGLTKFVLVPADPPTNWDEELDWLREVTGPLET